MATSGSTDFSIDRDSIIEEALQIVGVLGVGEAPTAAQLTDYSRTLNLIVKSLMAEGLLLWTIDRLVIFPVPNQEYYTIGSGGDRVCKYTDYVKTEVATAAASGATTLVVDSIANMTASDVIGVEQDDGTLHWTTISGTPSAATITLAVALTAAVSVDRHVYTYTTAITGKPLRIEEGFIRQDGDSDVPIEFISRNDYMVLANKKNAGRINQAYFNPRRDSSEIWVWEVPDGNYLKEVLIITAQSLIEDFDTAADTLDFPIEWARFLVWELSADLGFHTGVESARLKMIQNKAATLKEDVSSFDVEMESMFMIPDFNGSAYRR